ncbi:MAG: hypothetical protein LUQ14_04650 [Methanomassiliicoccales archaeon]|nr:hypothetical protein [Methanomassiliicoccales archaeon]
MIETDLSTEAFESLGQLFNSFYRREIVRIDGGNIIPCEPRMALVLERVLRPQKRRRGYDPNSPRSGISASGHYRNDRFLGIPKGLVAETSRTGLTGLSHASGKSKSADGGKVIRGPELSLLLAVLRFRAKGYVVQRPLGSHWGPKDIVAWKSPVIEKLRKFRVIENGCLVDELLHIREMDRVETSTVSDSSTDDLAFITTATSARDAMKDDGAMNRLIGSSWLHSDPGKYTNRTNDAAAANRLYVDFPMNASRSSLRSRTLEDLIAEFEQRQRGREKVGLIILEPGRLHFKESSDFPYEQRDEQIRKYEMNIRRILLENFRVHELFDFMEKLDVEFCRDFEDQIFWEFDEKIRRLEIETILSELMTLIAIEEELQ